MTELTAEQRAVAIVSNPSVYKPAQAIALIAAAITAAELAQMERDCAILQGWAAHYPTDVFPEDGKSLSCASARFARNMMRYNEDDIRAAYAERTETENTE